MPSNRLLAGHHVRFRASARARNPPGNKFCAVSEPGRISELRCRRTLKISSSKTGTRGSRSVTAPMLSIEDYRFGETPEPEPARETPVRLSLRAGSALRELSLKRLFWLAHIARAVFEACELFQEGESDFAY